jgi:hypothetical protein
MLRIFSVVAIGASLLSIGPASAAIITINYTGQIFGGTANANDGTFCGILCTPSGYEFSGQGFTLTYVFDTSLAAPGNYTNIGTSSQLSGSWNGVNLLTIVGSATGLPSIAGFNPAICTIPGCGSTEMDAASVGFSYSQSVSWRYNTQPTGADVSTALFANPGIPGDITTTFTLSGADIGNGSFDSFASPGSVCGAPANWMCQSGNLQIESISVSVSTPLPAALPLFATGIGGLGLLGWRRKRKGRRCAE